MMQLSAALNVCQYLLIKADMTAKANDSENLHNPFEINFISEDDGIKSHPVIERLNHLNILQENLEESVEKNVPDLKDQLDSLRKASYLMQHGDVEESDNERLQQDQNDDPSDNDNSIDSHSSNSCDRDKEDSADGDSRHQRKDSAKDNIHLISRNDMNLKRQVFNEARFSLRSYEDDMDVRNNSRKRRSLTEDSDYLYGDQEVETLTDIKAGKSLTATLNTITQKLSGKKHKSADPEEEDEDFVKALAIMEKDIGSGDEYDNDFDNMDGDGEDEGWKDPEEEGFYSKIQQKSKNKKKMKSDMYSVAPKYPRLDEEIEGERPVGRVIMKNRGLKKHRPKLNRNPRVKKREQYRKAIIRRKGAVRDIRTGEGHKYGGEETGIKSGLSRSRKLGVK